MSIVRLTKCFHFEMAHALNFYDGLCRNIHGHSYRLEVTVKGEPIQDVNSPKNGMLMDFSDLKHIVESSIIQRFDHALVLSSQTSQDLIEMLKKYYKKIEIVDYQPTSENFIMDFVPLIQPHLPKGVQLYSITLGETASSYVQWLAEDNQ